MQLHDIIKPIEQQTDEELLERLRAIRHTRSVIRPAAAQRTKKAAIKKARGESKKAATKIDKLLDGLTPEQVQELLKQLGA